MRVTTTAETAPNTSSTSAAEQASGPPRSWSVYPPPRRMLVLPLAFTPSLAGLGLVDPVRQNANLLVAFVGLP